MWIWEEERSEKVVRSIIPSPIWLFKGREGAKRPPFKGFAGEVVSSDSVTVTGEGHRSEETEDSRDFAEDWVCALTGIVVDLRS